MAKPMVSYQVASALLLGQRVNQEDALATDFAIGDDMGFAVLSDGMGGHNAGEVASHVVVTEVFSELKFRSGRAHAIDGHVREALLHAAQTANACVGDVASEAPEAHGMGATLVVPFFNRDELHWISIGDSPLYLHRNGSLRQLNEDHSMGPHIDMMVRSGMLTERKGRDHPDRNCLTSVLVGKPISRIDCPEEPTHLQDGDVVIAASDGVQSIPHADMQTLVERHAEDSSDTIARALIHEIETRAEPDQDNVSFVVVKISRPGDAAVFMPGKTLQPEVPATLDNAFGNINARPRNKLHTSLARFLHTSPSTVK